MEATQQEIPEEGELVLATAREITAHGVYLTLDEYSDLRGFLHISEISTGWVRHIERYVKAGQKIVVKVVRISKTRHEVDVSLRQVTGDERKQKLIEVKQTDRADTVLDAVKTKLAIGDDEILKIKSAMSQEFGNLYDALVEVARKGSKALEKLNLGEQYLGVIESVAKEKIPVPTVEVRGIISATCPLPNGVEVLREALTAADGAKGSSTTVTITYVGAPRYRIAVAAENYKVAEKVLETAVEKVREMIEKGKGSFSFKREGSTRRTVE